MTLLFCGKKLFIPYFFPCIFSNGRYDKRTWVFVLPKQTQGSEHKIPWELLLDNAFLIKKEKVSWKLSILANTLGLPHIVSVHTESKVETLNMFDYEHTLVCQGYVNDIFISCVLCKISSSFRSLRIVSNVCLLTLTQAKFHTT